MRDRKASLPLAGMFEMFSAGGAKKFDCTIDRFCRTQVCEFPGSVFALEASSPPHVIYEKGHFRATITNGPQMFLNDSAFSPHYSASYSLYGTFVTR